MQNKFPDKRCFSYFAISDREGMVWEICSNPFNSYKLEGDYRIHTKSALNIILLVPFHIGLIGYEC